MSLADAGSAPRRDHPRAALGGDLARSLHRPDLAGLLARVFGPEPSALPDQLLSRNFDLAHEVIRCGAAHMAELHTRFHRIESDLGAATRRHHLELEEARRELTRWQTIAQELSLKLRQTQLDLAEVERLRTVEEQRADREAQRADDAERRTQGFERVAQAFHDGLRDVLHPGAVQAAQRAA